MADVLDRIVSGLNSSAIGTLVDRKTRFTMLLHCRRYRVMATERQKNGPALAGHGAEAVRDAIAREMTSLPEQLRRSRTWDLGPGSGDGGMRAERAYEEPAFTTMVQLPKCP